MTLYGRDKNREQKNLEKANNSPSYRCAAIKKDSTPIQFKLFEL